MSLSLPSKTENPASSRKFIVAFRLLTDKFTFDYFGKCLVLTRITLSIFIGFQIGLKYRNFAKFLYTLSQNTTYF